MQAQLLGLPAGVPKISELVKPIAAMEKGVMAQVKPMADTLIKPAYQFLTGPIAAMGIEVPTEMLAPAETIEFAAMQIEAGKLPVPTKAPGITMPFQLPGMPRIGEPMVQGGGLGIEKATTTSPGTVTEPATTTSPGTVTEPERVLPEEAKPGGLVTSLYSIEERRRRMWMSL